MADYQLSYTGDQVNTAIGQIINKNITGTLTVETLDLTNSLAITQGGTGATTAAAARKAILENKALSIAEGGTGKTTAAEAREALGITGSIISDVTQTNNGRIMRTIKYENGDMEQYMWSSNISMTFVANGNRFMDFVTFEALEGFADPSKIFIYGSCVSNAGIAFLYANAFDNGSKKALCYFDCPTAGVKVIEHLTIYAKGRWK